MIWSSVYYFLNLEESLSISTISLTFFFGLSSCAWKYLLIHLVRDEHKVHISKHAYASEQLQFARPESEMMQLDEYDEQASWIKYFGWFFTVIKNRWAVWFVWCVLILPPDIFQRFSFCWSRVDLDVDRCIWFQIAADDVLSSTLSSTVTDWVKHPAQNRIHHRGTRIIPRIAQE